jgi:glycosyltransferase involved in cell wall biosynthesis
MVKTVSLTLQTASAALRERIDTLFGPDTMYVDLSSLRRFSYLRIFKELRAYRCEAVVVPIEKLNDLAIMPIITAVAAVVPARQHIVLMPDDERRSFGYLVLIGGVMRVLCATIKSAIFIIRCHCEAADLLRQPRIPLTTRLGADQVAYLFVNFTSGLVAGGSYGHIAGVCGALMDRGYGVEFYHIDDGPPVRKTAKYERISLPNTLSFPLGLNQYWFHTLAVARMQPNLSAKTHAFIYQRLALGNFAGVVLSRATGIPLIVEYNGSEVWVARNWSYGVQFRKTAEMSEEVLLRHAHLIVTISDPLREELVARGVDPARIVTYPNGVDSDMFDPDRFSSEANTALRTSLGLKASAKVVTFVGTFGHWHGAEVLASAIGSLVADRAAELRRLDVKFLWVGDGLTMPRVREILSDPACDEFVRYTGTVPQRECPRYLAISDICIAPHIPNADGTKFFGSPTKLFEYMVMGKAIVASALDQIGEVLSPGVRAEDLGALQEPGEDEDRLAVLTVPGDAGQLAKAIVFLAQSSAWSKILGRNARRKALDQYSWRVHVDRIIKGFERVQELEWSKKSGIGLE